MDRHNIYEAVDSESNHPVTKEHLRQTIYMSDIIKFNYRGTECTYDERLDRWTFDLRGRERHTKTPKAAKDAIDAPKPKDETPFERKQAMIFAAYCNPPFQEVTVTSIVPEERQAWTVDKDGRRTKRGYWELLEVSEGNEKVMAEYVALVKESRKLSAIADAKLKALIKLKL